MVDLILRNVPYCRFCLNPQIYLFGVTGFDKTRAGEEYFGDALSFHSNMAIIT